MIHRSTNRTTMLGLCGLLLLSMSFAACQSLSRTERGAAIGAGAGAVIGGAVGARYGDTAKGAIIGAAVGGTAGAVIGQQMDRQARELEEQLAGAEIDRAGEGILLRFGNNLLFDFDSATLRPAAQTELQKLADHLRNYPYTDVVIIGHTDAVGSATYNLGLSQRRAQSSADFLISQGVAPRRVTTVGKGLHEPIASNETDVGRQQNRRVEMALFASEEYRDDVAQQY